eukprot:gene5532-7212_t
MSRACTHPLPLPASNVLFPSNKPSIDIHILNRTLNKLITSFAKHIDTIWTKIYTAADASLSLGTDEAQNSARGRLYPPTNLYPIPHPPPPPPPPPPPQLGKQRTTTTTTTCN